MSEMCPVAFGEYTMSSYETMGRSRSFGDWWSDEWPVMIFCSLLIGLVCAIGMAIAAGIRDDRTRDRLMRECLTDGHKEYECVALLKTPQGGSTIVMPLPMGR